MSTRYCVALLFVASSCMFAEDLEVTVTQASVSPGSSCMLGSTSKPCANIQARARVNNTTPYFTMGVTRVDFYVYAAGSDDESLRLGGTFELNCHERPWMVSPHEMSPLIAIDLAYDPATQNYRLGYPCGSVKKWRPASNTPLGWSDAPREEFGFVARPRVGDELQLDLVGSLERDPVQTYMGEARAVLGAQ